MSIPQESFGRVDLIVASVIALIAIVALITAMPDLVRYIKMKSM